jgi:inositol phosphorylceramide mannosyltransferase catalytic subunit
MIPKTFHQIWINRAKPELPAEYAGYRDSWLRLHPEWDYKLWNLDNLDFPLRRPELIEQCKSYAQMADVLRMEVLWAHGGVYLDTDFECFKSIDALVAHLDVFSCSENGITVSTGFMGAAPKSRLIERLLMNMPDRLGALAPNLETGPGYVTRQVLGGGFGNEFALLPSRRFYPYAMGEPRATSLSHPAAYAAHHWAHSWLDPKDRLLSRRILAKLRRWLGRSTSATAEAGHIVSKVGIAE